MSTEFYNGINPLSFFQNSDGVSNLLLRSGSIQNNIVIGLGVAATCVLTTKVAQKVSSYFQPKKRLYVDGIYDLLHVGHVRQFKHIKEKYPEYELVIGVINDKDATGYKREPIIKEADRYEMFLSTKYVDTVLKNAPLIVTPEFLLKNNIDLVVHGFSTPEDREKQKDFFEAIKDKFEEIPYNFGTSTTDTISRIFNQRQKELGEKSKKTQATQTAVISSYSNKSN